MNTRRLRRKKQLCKIHREERYLHAIGEVIEGKADPNYATYRWQRLKAIREK